MEDGTGEELTSYTYTKDVQGSIMELVGADEKSVTGYQYDAYGNTTITGKQTTANELAYTGGVYDKTTEEYYLNARYYDPKDGRFLTQDTYRGEEKDANTWNLYSYCGGNPVNYVDPSGHNALVAWASSAWWLCAVDGPVPIGDAVYVAGLVVGGIATAVLADNLAKETSKAIQKTQVRETKYAPTQTITLSDITKVNKVSGKKYRLAYVYKGKLHKLAPKMSFETALLSLGVTGAINGISKIVSLNQKKLKKSKGYKKIMNCRSFNKKSKPAIGIYASTKRAAKSLAFVTGANNAPEVHGKKKYGHYHDKNHTIHIWYGKPIVTPYR